MAEDYRRRLSEAMDLTNQLYSEYIGEVASSTGITAEVWQRCTRSNSTWQDCPVAEAEAVHNDTYEMIVATHNPSNLALNVVEISVAHENYDVLIFNESQWELAEHDFWCNEEYLEVDQKQKVKNCKLYVKQTVKPGQIAFTHLVKSPYHGNWGSIFQSTAHHIENDQVLLTYKTYSKSTVKFELTDKATGAVEPLEFSLNQWHSYGKWGEEGEADEHQKTGAYIFKPDDNAKESLPFTHFHAIHSHVGKTTQEFVIYFEPGFEQHSHGKAIVVVSLQDLPVVRFDVKLYGLPKTVKFGQEVTVNFRAPNIDNNQTFYTDSNGLQM